MLVEGVATCGAPVGEDKRLMALAELVSEALPSRASICGATNMLVAKGSYVRVQTNCSSAQCQTETQSASASLESEAWRGTSACDAVSTGVLRGNGWNTSACSLTTQWRA